MKKMIFDILMVGLGTCCETTSDEEMVKRIRNYTVFSESDEE